MRVLKHTAPPEQKLQALENFLTENNMFIDHGYNGLQVSVDGRVFELRDIEMHETVERLPRMVDSERMIVPE